MKGHFIFLTLILGSVSAHAGIYSDLSEAQRASVEQALITFLPELNAAAMSVLEEVENTAPRSIEPNDVLKNLPWDTADAFYQILENHQSSSPDEVTLTERVSLKYSELQRVTKGGIELLRIIEQKNDLTADAYSRALNQRLFLDEDGERINVIVDPLGFPYCNVMVVLDGNHVSIRESCD